MRLKDGVSIAGLRMEMRPVLISAERIWNIHNRELVITSGLDGCHSAGSFHYYGLALDFRTRYFGKGESEKVAKDLQLMLGDNYDVVLHVGPRGHIHVEYDPERTEP